MYIFTTCIKPCTHIARTPHAARIAKWTPASTLRLPRMEAAAGGANASRCFHVLKGASLRVARSDWTAARASLQNGQRKMYTSN
jgi:NAD(P)H-hydrate repair Nnr-like enzyme with NAD(P)H-hydrate dehydratase domain